MTKLYIAVTVGGALLTSIPAEGRERDLRPRRARRGAVVRTHVPLARMTAEMGFLVVNADKDGATTLTDGTVTVRICPGMSTILVAGQPVCTRRGVEAHGNEILISPDAYRILKEAIRRARVNAIREVVIDPGHGGSDTGAIGMEGLYEKDVNLSVSLRVAELLRQRGIRVHLTRDSDVFVPLDERVAICNREKPDLFVSIHANASVVRDVTGIETFYVRETIDDGARARDALAHGAASVEGVDLTSEEDNLGLALHHVLFDMSRRRSMAIGERVCDSLERGLSSPNRGVKEAGFRVLKGARCPAVLVETGFLSNPSTEQKYKQQEYLDKVAEAIAAAI
jgi:N-acetylmuramoyl-L-alanine amidase